MEMQSNEEHMFQKQINKQARVNSASPSGAFLIK